MPNQQNPNAQTSPSHCFARRHLTPAQFLVYDVCVAWSRTPSPDHKFKGKHVVYFDGRKIAAESASLSPATVYRTVKQLEKFGWLEKLQNSRWVEGKQSATVYRVLDHSEWAQKHGAQCAFTRAVQHAQRFDLDALTGGSQVEKNPIPDHRSDSHSETRSSQFEKRSSQDETRSSQFEKRSSHQEYTACTKACTEPIQEAHTEAGSVPPVFSSFSNSGEDRTDSTAQPRTQSHYETASDNELKLSHKPKPVYARPPEVHHGKILWDLVEQRYTDSITGNAIYVDEINERIAPNTFSGSAFHDPAGNRITLEQAQEKEKELVNA